MPAGDTCPTQGSGITNHLQKDPTTSADNLSHPVFQLISSHPFACVHLIKQNSLSCLELSDTCVWDC